VVAKRKRLNKPNRQDGSKVMLGDGNKMRITLTLESMFLSMTKTSFQVSQANLSLGKVIGFMPILIANLFCHHQVKARDEGRGTRDEWQKATDGV
jgi:hypothetical protein